MNKSYQKELEWVSSEVVSIEINNTPDIERREYVARIVKFARRSLNIQERDLKRGAELENLGFKSFDAMHLACAERAAVDVFFYH